MAYGRKPIPLELSDYSEGTNSVLRASEVGKRYIRGRTRSYQCVECMDAMLHNNKRRPAVEGITDITDERVYGIHSYLRIDGTDTLLALFEGKLYSINKTTGARTELYDLGTAGEGYFEDYLDKCWIANGQEVVKAEGSTVYPVMMAAPSGAAAAAYTGGTIPDGVYGVYISYGRRVSGTTVLYSKGESLGDVTIAGGNSTIRITDFDDSADAQAGRKIVWITDVGAAVPYLHLDAADGAGGTIDIANTSGKNSSLLYEVQAATNDDVPNFEYIHFHDKRLWGTINNIVYYSLQQGTVYDLERFDTDADTGRLINLPFKIAGMFSIGMDLFFSTPGGIIKLPDGNPDERFVILKSGDPLKPLYFKHPRTVASWANGMIGLTQDGVRHFDGGAMSTQDIGQDVKDKIDAAYDGDSTHTHPAAAIVRRDSRTEYHLVYQDTTVSLSMNNRRLVLNLDKLALLPENKVRAAWETWSISGNHLALDPAGALFVTQSGPSSIIYKDRVDNRMIDTDIYVGISKTTQRIPQFRIRSGTMVVDLEATMRWQHVRVLAKFLKTFNVRIQIVSRSTAATGATISPTIEGGFVLGVGQLGVDRFAPDVPEVKSGKLPRNLKGPAMYVEITQDGEDKYFELMELLVSGILVKGRKT